MDWLLTVIKWWGIGFAICTGVLITHILIVLLITFTFKMENELETVFQGVIAFSGLSFLVGIIAYFLTNH